MEAVTSWWWEEPQQRTMFDRCVRRPSSKCLHIKAQERNFAIGALGPSTRARPRKSDTQVHKLTCPAEVANRAGLPGLGNRGKEPPLTAKTGARAEGIGRSPIQGASRSSLGKKPEGGSVAYAKPHVRKRAKKQGGAQATAMGNANCLSDVNPRLYAERRLFLHRRSCPHWRCSTTSALRILPKQNKTQPPMGTTCCQLSSRFTTAAERRRQATIAKHMRYVSPYHRANRRKSARARVPSLSPAHVPHASKCDLYYACACVLWKQFRSGAPPRPV